jgi:hypothetical protein
MPQKSPPPLATVGVKDRRLQWTRSSFRVSLECYQSDTFVAKDENLDDTLIGFNAAPREVRGWAGHVPDGTNSAAPCATFASTR